MTETKRETWVCTMGNYKEIEGLRIPFSAAVLWRLDTGDYPYAKFEVQKIAYPIPPS